MKKYVPIIIGIVALCAVLYVGDREMKKNSADLAVDEQKSADMITTSFQGKVTKMFEGENTLLYGFDLPETATTTVEKEGALVKVTEDGASVLAMYVSFEGGRGYLPDDYINKVIAPAVKLTGEKTTVTIGKNDFEVVRSATSEWHVAKVENGAWLLVIESKKTDNEKVASILESLVTKIPALVTPSVVEVMEGSTTTVEATTSEAAVSEMEKETR